MARKTKKWIAKAIKRPGALRKALGIKKGKTIPVKTLRKTAKKAGRIGRQARLAITLRKLRKRKKHGSYPGHVEKSAPTSATRKYFG